MQCLLHDHSMRLLSVLVMLGLSRNLLITGSIVCSPEGAGNHFPLMVTASL